MIAAADGFSAQMAVRTVDRMTASGDREDDPVLSADDTLEDGRSVSGSFLRTPSILWRISSTSISKRRNHQRALRDHRGDRSRRHGVVYAAFDRSASCALPSRQRSSDSAAAVAGTRVRIKVRHRNICLVNEIHTASTGRGDIDFLTMELLEGPTLQEHLASAGRLTPNEAMEIGRQLCSGLAEAHRIGIVHKDLKPGNVILSSAPDGTRRVVITDFGLAGEPDAAAELAGTPRYMAPELWRGATASRATDIYALGVILQEMTAGGDRRLDAIIARCVDPSPSARPRDAAEVMAALAPPSPSQKRVAAAMIAAVLGLAAGLIVVPKQCARPAVRLAILPSGFIRRSERDHQRRVERRRGPAHESRRGSDARRRSGRRRHSRAAYTLPNRRAGSSMRHMRCKSASAVRAISS